MHFTAPHIVMKFVRRKLSYVPDLDDSLYQNTITSFDFLRAGFKDRPILCVTNWSCFDYIHGIKTLLFFKGWLSSLPYEYMGCVKFEIGSVPTLEGEAKQLDGSYKRREDARCKCYDAAKERGWSVFTLSDNGACNSGPDALYTYREKGPGSCGSYSGGSNTAAAYIVIGKQFASYASIVLQFIIAKPL